MMNIINYFLLFMISIIISIIFCAFLYKNNYSITWLVLIFYMIISFLIYVVILGICASQNWISIIGGGVYFTVFAVIPLKIGTYEHIDAFLMCNTSAQSSLCGDSIEVILYLVVATLIATTITWVTNEITYYYYKKFHLQVS